MSVYLEQSCLIVSTRVGYLSFRIRVGGWNGEFGFEGLWFGGWLVHTCQRVESRVSGRGLGIGRFFLFLEVRGGGPPYSRTLC